MEKSIQNKLLKADKTFQEWRKVPFSEKQKRLSKLAKLLLKNKEELGKTITKEMNKPISQSISEIDKCA